AAAEVDFDEFPAQRELSRGPAGFRQQYPRARRRKTCHCARIGHMHGRLLTRREDDIGEKPLVPADQGRGDERRGETHELGAGGCRSWRRLGERAGGGDREDCWMRPSPGSFAVADLSRAEREARVVRDWSGGDLAGELVLDV